ncbi:MAG: hypothetical protein R3E97_24745, partial [Candidatus Eisenbacteria bacterium]
MLLLAVGLVATLAAQSHAGPNEGGTLILHASTTVTYTTTTSDYCGMSTLASCDLANTTVNGHDTAVIYVFAAFDSSAAPRLSGVAFGAEYDESRIAILDYGSCGDFELPDPDWPETGTGTSVTWNSAQESHLHECYWFATHALPGGSTTQFTLVAHPTQDGVFADDAVPSRLDPILGFGTVGFGTPGLNSCPGTMDGESDEGPMGNDGSDPPLDDHGISDAYAPGVAVVVFRPGALQLPPQLDYSGTHFRLPWEAVSTTNYSLHDRFSSAGATYIEPIGPAWRHLSGLPTMNRHGEYVTLVDFTDVYLVFFDDGVEVDRFVSTISGHEDVLRASGSSPMIADVLVPDDPFFAQQYHLDNPGIGDCEFDIDINAPEGWDLSNAWGTKIGVCDEPMVAHEDVLPWVDPSLSRSFINGYSWLSDEALASHGLWVAGVAGARTNNSTGVSGVANFDGAVVPDDGVLVLLRTRGGALVNAKQTHSQALDYQAGEAYPQILVSNHSWSFPSWSDCSSYDLDFV